MPADAHTLLVCTVGGTPNPIVTSLLEWSPDRVLFIASPQTRAEVDAVLRACGETSGLPLSPGQYDVTLVPDSEDLEGCVAAIRELEREVVGWVGREGAKYAVVVDFTAGTKCMTAALALVSQRWPCRYSYVGGTRRTKEGVGVVESGAERLVHRVNPWDALGYQAVEDFVVLFDQHAFAAAARLVGGARERVEHAARTREMSTLEQLARAFDGWDRFDHRACRNALNNVEKNGNDLRGTLGGAVAQRLNGALPRLRAHIDALLEAVPPSRSHVIDLLANAKRRRDEGRIDDAVARLYRAIEAAAQVALKERHGLESTENVPLNRVPAALRPDWDQKARDGAVALGLQNAYALLAALDDPAGKRFRSAGLDGRTSPLAARNRSILAHGFERVSEGVFDHLWTAALSLAGIEEANLPSCPVLGSRARARTSPS